MRSKSAAQMSQKSNKSLPTPAQHTQQSATSHKQAKSCRRNLLFLATCVFNNAGFCTACIVYTPNPSHAVTATETNQGKYSVPHGNGRTWNREETGAREEENWRLLNTWPIHFTQLKLILCYGRNYTDQALRTHSFILTVIFFFFFSPDSKLNNLEPDTCGGVGGGVEQESKTIISESVSHEVQYWTLDSHT